MSTLFIDRKDAALDAESGAIVLRVGGMREGTIPLGPLERVIVRGAASLSTRFLGELWRNGTGLLVLSGRRNEPTARLLGRPHSDARLRLAQYRLALDESRRTSWSRALLARKFAGQQRLLEQAREHRPDLRLELGRGAAALTAAQERVAAFAGARSGLMGIEGAAAAAYFAAFGSLFAPALEFFGRNRRPPRDPVNAVLSLGYTLLHFEAAVAAHGAGLDPLLGIYHESAWARESLASDLIEPLRVHVDGWIWKLFRERVLRVEDFSRAEGTCLVGKAGRQRFYTEWEKIAPPLRRLLRRHCRELAAGLSARMAGQEPGALAQDDV